MALNTAVPMSVPRERVQKGWAGACVHAHVSHGNQEAERLGGVGLTVSFLLFSSSALCSSSSSCRCFASRSQPWHSAVRTCSHHQPKPAHSQLLRSPCARTQHNRPVCARESRRSRTSSSLATFFSCARSRSYPACISPSATLADLACAHPRPHIPDARGRSTEQWGEENADPCVVSARTLRPSKVTIREPS
jgi:hypothetical protein